MGALFLHASVIFRVAGETKHLDHGWRRGVGEPEIRVHRRAIDVSKWLFEGTAFGDQPVGHRRLVGRIARNEGWIRQHGGYVHHVEVILA